MVTCVSWVERPRIQSAFLLEPLDCDGVPQILALIAAKIRGFPSTADGGEAGVGRALQGLQKARQYFQCLLEGGLCNDLSSGN